jgi:cytochrome P450
LFVFQGFESISTSLELFSLFLSFYPEVQDKMFAEVQSVFSTKDEEVTKDHLKQLVYLDMVVKEVMRLWPPIPFIARCSSEDMQIGEF